MTKDQKIRFEIEMLEIFIKHWDLFLERWYARGNEGDRDIYLMDCKIRAILHFFKKGLNYD